MNGVLLCLELRRKLIYRHKKKLKQRIGVSKEKLVSTKDGKKSARRMLSAVEKKQNSAKKRRRKEDPLNVLNVPQEMLKSANRKSKKRNFFVSLKLKRKLQHRLKMKPRHRLRQPRKQSATMKLLQKRPKTWVRSMAPRKPNK